MKKINKTNNKIFFRLVFSLNIIFFKIDLVNTKGNKQNKIKFKYIMILNK